MKASKRGFACLKTGAVLLFVFMVFFVPIKGARAAGPAIPYSFFLENPYAITGFRANVEVVDLDDPPGGVLIMNQYRVDVNLYQNLLGVYAKFPFAGVIDFGPSAEFGLNNTEDDYDFGNIGLGAKFGLLNLDYLILTGGFEVMLPTTTNDLGAEAARAYFRDFSYFVDEAVTLDPYLVLGVSKSIFSFQANVDFDILTNADEIDGTPFNTGGDDVELIIKYGATGSVTPDLPLPFSTTFLVELLLASSTSFDDNVTGVYVTPGVRFGGRIVSIGAGVQIPFGSNEISDFANVDFLFDLVIRFGS